MKILQLDIEGFRSLRKVSWSPGDLNVLIGPNASGKSNLLRFLELMSISAQGRLGRYIQSQGGMDSLVWDGEASSIYFKLKTSLFRGSQDIENEMTYELRLARLGKTSVYRVQKEIAGPFIPGKGKKEL